MHDDGARALVVVDHDGQARGIVAEAAVSALPEQRRPWVTVASVARQVDSDSTRPSTSPASSCCAGSLPRAPPEYLVLDGRGAVFGVLSRADVELALGHLGVSRDADGGASPRGDRSASATRCS